MQIDFGKFCPITGSNFWWIENDYMWFVGMGLDALFRMDKGTRQIEMVSVIPSPNVSAGKQHSICMKKGNVIFCLPNKANDIWCYHLSEDRWTSLSIENPKKIRLRCSKAWFVQEQLFMVSMGLGKIIELDVNTEQITNSYHLPEDAGECIAESVLVDHCIYTVASNPAGIYKFDCMNKKIQRISLSGITDQIRTICFDGNKFWLSGRRKNIYVWNEQINEIKCVRDFPEEFGIYNFSGNYSQLLNSKEEFAENYLFFTSVYVGQFIWFIPFQTNEILYMNKDTYEIQVFPLKEENQTEEDVKVQLEQRKYLFEYVRDSRYMVLFSLKNRWFIEIDCQKLEYVILDFKLDSQMAFQIEKNYLYGIFQQGNLLYEQECVGLKALFSYLQLTCRKTSKNLNDSGDLSNGGLIYQHLCN